MCGENSLTWSGHIRILFIQYNLPDPLELLTMPPWPKELWKQHTKVAVISHHESIWRQSSVYNCKTKYLHIQATGLSGRPHPVLAWAQTTQNVERIRPHIKMLSEDYLCYASLANDRGIDPQCWMCQVLSTHPSPTEDLVHLLTMCRATADTRNRILPELLNTVASSDPSNSLLTSTNHDTLTQFILDCSSLNLPANTRVPPNHPGFVNITKQCSNLINGIHKERTRQMKALGLLGRI